MARIVERLAPDLHDDGLAPVGADVGKRLGEHSRFVERLGAEVTSSPLR